MKKDLSKYYAEVTEKDAKKVSNIYNKLHYDRDVEWVKWAISERNFFISIVEGNFRLCNEMRVRGKKKISLKTFQNYIAYNNQVDRSFVEPIGLKKLTEKVNRQREVIEICNDKLNEQLDLNDKLKRENYAKTAVIAILAFTLLISWIFITQKL